MIAAEATEAARAEAERVLANANAALADASRKSAGRTPGSPELPAQAAITPVKEITARTKLEP